MRSAPALNLARLLSEQSAAHPDHTVVHFLKDGEATAATLTFAQLWARSAAIARRLREQWRAGERIGLLHEAPHEFLCSFFGCQLAGLIAVPLPATGRKAQQQIRSTAYLTDADAVAVLTDERGRSKLPPALPCEVLVTNTIAASVVDVDILVDVAPSEPAYLQYTSGSTGNPKGVCITHANVLANLQQIAERLELSRGLSVVSWLPHHHDQGLVGGLLVSVFMAGTCHVMTPASFIARPLRWLEVISRYRGDLSGAPNFAFEYCMRAAGQSQEPLRLDLSAWRVAFNGAERVFPQTLRDFTECFAPYGFRPSAWSPSYGLAEATLAVSMMPPSSQVAADGVLTVECEGSPHVACGPAMPGTQIRIVDADTGIPRAEGEVGEIWLRGPSISTRYWKHPMPVGVAAETDATYLRTGDFGFVRDGNLFVMGRREDRFKVRGRNLFAADLERACRGADPAIADCAAFTADLDVMPHLAVELRRVSAGKVDLPRLAQSVAEAVNHALDVLPAAIHFVRQGALPRTTSGKVRRSECAALLLAARLDTLGVYSPAQSTARCEQVVVPDPLLRNVRSVFHSLGLDECGEADPDAMIRLDSVDHLRVQHALVTTLGVDLDGWFPCNTLRDVCDAVRASAGQHPASQISQSLTEAPLTDLQQDILIADRLCDSVLFTVGCVIRMEGVLDLQTLNAAFCKLLERHLILACTVAARSPGEFVLRPAEAVPVVQALSGEPDALEQWFTTPIVPGVGALIRIGLYHQRGASCIALAAHHIVVDHGSLAQIARELGEQCRAPLGRLPAVRPYSAFAQSHALTMRQRRSQLRSFWQEKLRNVADPPLLNGAVRRPIRAWRVLYASRDLPLEALRSITACSTESGASISTVILAAYGLLIARCTSMSDIVVSCAVSLREEGDFATTVGYLVNTLPVVVRAKADAPFADLCRTVREELDAARCHAAYAQHLIGRELPPQEDPGAGSPLTRYVFNFLDERFAVPAVQSRRSHPVAELQLTVRLGTQSVSLELSALAERYEQEFLEQIAESLAHVLTTATRQARRSLRDVGVLSAGQTARLQSFDGPVLIPNRRRLDEWIGLQAGLYADRVAVTAPAAEGTWEHLTYSALHERAQAVAASLPPVRGKPVAIAMERSIDQIIATLGVLQAGAVYMPVDPYLPPARVRSMLEDAGTANVLTDLANLDYDKSARAPRLADLSDQEPATLIYTSGSSGRPKGVLLAHCVYAARLAAMQQELAIHPDDVFIQKTSISFDVSLWEIFLPLVSGARLVMAPRAVSFDPKALTAILATAQVSIVHFVPTVLREWLADGEPARVKPHLRRCLCSGEALRAQDRDRFVEVLPDTRLVNLYGPTECGIDVTWSTELGHCGDPPIGRPTAGSRIRIVSEHQPVPPGVPGELTIAGSQLAMGYWGRPDLTAARFVPAADGLPGERAYLSGDHAAWRPDGQLTYLGRMDGQVKVRGVRIELDEVRHAILTHPQAEQAEVLLVSRNGVQVLAAAILGRRALTPAQMQEHLLDRLPATAVPTLLQVLPALPVLANGKCDLARLRATFEALEEAAPAVSNTAVAVAIARAWQVVLGVAPQPGARFFTQGGDSLKAIRLVNELAQGGIRTSVAEIYRWQSIEDQARHFIPEHASTRGEPQYRSFSLLTAKARQNISLEGLDDAYPLSQLQRTVVMHSFGESRYETYVSGMRVRGPFSRAAFEAAVSRLMRMHPFLRSCFDLTSTTEPLQLVHKSALPRLNIRDLRDLDTAVARRSIEEWTQRELHEVFQWNEAPLLRFTIHRLRGDELVISMTEAALDGWCVALVFRDLMVGYDAFVAGRSPPVPPELPGYGVFVELEREAARSQDSRQYWRERVRRLSPQQCPRGAFPRVNVRRHERTEIRVPPSTVGALQALAASRGCSLKHVFFAVYCVMLAVLRERSTVLAMIECNGRPECPGGDGMVGVFNNILPVVVDVAGKTWGQLADELYELETRFQPHRRFPIAEILREFGGRSMGDALFVFTRFHVLEELRQLEHIAVLDAWASDETYLPLTFHVNDSTWHGMRILLDYDAADFAPAQIEWLAGWLRETLAKLPDSMEILCREAAPAVPDEMRWGELRAVTDRVLAQCRLRPCATAMVEGSRSITYAQLQQRACRTTGQLIAHGVRPGDDIGLIASSGIDAACAMLGAWMGGICCVLLDPAQPRRRLDMQLAGSKVKVALVEEPAWDLIGDGTIRRLPLEPRTAAEGTAEPLPRASMHPLQAAYILHTSGSSGNPKPVAVSHAALANYVANALVSYEIEPGHRVWSHSSIGFDFTLTTLIAPLCAGAQVHITARDDFTFMFSNATAADVIKLTPTHLQLLQRHPDVTPGRLPGRIIVGGELLRADAVGALLRMNSTLRIFNEYGPTEACVGCSVHECDARGDDAVETIGRPIEGMRSHLLDRNLAPITADDVVGELYLSGTGLAMGYPGHAGLTSERFLPCPTGPAGSLMYRTGDAAKYVAGKLVCIGRTDRQVKILGYRVELGEIESCLASCAEVARAAADLRHGHLVAWILPHQQLDTGRLQRIGVHLETHLPAYMRPQRLYAMKTVPLTAHGKMDYTALLEDEETLLTASAGGAQSLGSHPPQASADPRQQSLQAKLAAIWAEVLDCSEVSGLDNYFRLGGNSVSSILITAKARAAGIPVTTRLLLENPTLQDLVRALLAAQATRVASAEPRASAADTAYPLTPMQAGILHDCLLAPDEALYESHLVLELRAGIDPELLALAWNQTFRSNPVLRNRFTAGPDGLPLQSADDAVDCDLVVIDCQDEPARAAAALDAQKAHFSSRCRTVDRAPLCGLALVRLAAAHSLLLMTHHHLILDGWSQQQVLQELFGTYMAYHAGVEAERTARTEFRHYVARSRSRPSDLAFWRDYLGGARTGTVLTRDSADRRVTTRALPVATGIWSALESRTVECGVTPAVLVQAGWALALAAVAGTDDVTYGLTVSGRDGSFEPAEDFSWVVGMCINTVPLRARLASQQNVVSWLQEQQRDFWSVLARQHDALSDIQRAATGSAPQRSLFESIVVVENLPVASEGELQWGVAGFEIKEGLPIVLVVFLGSEPRVEMRLQPARCLSGVPERLSAKLALALRLLGSLPGATSMQTLLDSVRSHSAARAIPLTASARVPV